MTKKVKVVDAPAGGHNSGRKSPAQLIVESLGDEYKTMRDMAERYNVHIETMRRLCKAHGADGEKLVNAPSKAAQTGAMTIFLFTQEDVHELDEYFSKKGYVISAE